MTRLDSHFLLFCAIVPLFLFGLLTFCGVIASVRRGEISYRWGRWIRGHDVLGFWFIAALLSIAGLGVMGAAVWLGLRTL